MFSQSSQNEYTRIRVRAFGHVDFSKIDNRIKHDEPWQKAHPMQTAITVPAINVEEITHKLLEDKGIKSVTTLTGEEICNVMNGRNSSDSNTALYYTEDTQQLAEFNKFNDFFLLHRNPVHIESKKEVKPVLVEEENLNNSQNSTSSKNSDSPIKQASSTNEICNALRNASETIGNEFPDMQTGRSYNGNPTVDRPMQHEKYDVPPGYKRMTIWDNALETFCIATVPENTPALTREEIERYSLINPQ